MASRKEERLENKKRKAAAFLELVKDEELPDSKKLKTESSQDGDSCSSNIAVDENGRKVLVQEKEKKLSDEMFAEYKRVLKARQKATMQIPKVFLTLDELARYQPFHVDANGVTVTPPLFIKDVQHLLMFAVLNDFASFVPRWCRLLRVRKVTKVAAIVLDSVSAAEFTKYPESLPTLQQAFDFNVDMVAPVQYGSSVREDIMNVPIQFKQLMESVQLQGKDRKNKRKATERVSKVTIQQKWRKYQLARQLLHNPMMAIDETTKTPVKQNGSKEMNTDVLRNEGTSDDTEEDEEYITTYEQDKFDRRCLMLNSAQMLMESIPMPSDAENRSYQGFVYSKSTYKAVTSKSPLYAVDCEMVQTKASQMDLARVSFIDENLDVVLDTFVKPRAPVTNYVTRFSGITKEILDPVTIHVEDVQQIIQAFLPADAILCGQSIGGDLNSMKIFHPYIIDTSVIYNLTGTRQKTGLKALTSTFLSRSIQDSPEGHNSVEDASATMELVLLKLRNDVDFGDVKMSSTLSQNPPDTAVAESSVENLPSTETGNESDIKDSKSDISSTTRTLLSDQLSEELQRKRLFFQREGKQFIENFLERIKKQSKIGMIVDEAASVQLYPSSVPIVTCDNDKDSQKRTVASLQDSDFCFTHLYGYRNFLRKCQECDQTDEEELKKCLWKLDRRFWKIMMGLPKCSLFVVILAGREENGVVHSAKTFAKIV